MRERERVRREWTEGEIEGERESVRIARVWGKRGWKSLRNGKV